MLERALAALRLRAARRPIVFRYGGGVIMATLRSLAGGSMAALLGTAAVSTARETAAIPDAALISLCAEWVGLFARHTMLCAQQDAIPKLHTAVTHAEWNRLDDTVGDIGARMLALERQIPEVPAVTPAGQRAKAEVLLRLVRHISADHGGPTARSLARDLLGGGSGVTDR